MYRVLPFLIFAFFLISCNGREKKILPKETGITEAVYSSVIIQPDSLYQAFAAVNGIVENNLLEEGDLVKKGDPIVQIINSSPKLNTENARVALELARKNYEGQTAILKGIEEELRSARVQYLNDSVNFMRQKKLWEQGIGSKTAFETREMAFDISASSLEILRNKYSRTKNELQTQLRQAENNYRLSQINTTDFTVTSKINGRVYSLYKNPGETVNTNQPVASVGSASDFVIEMLVDEVDIVKIKEGQEVFLVLDAYGNKVFKARVNKIYPEKDERNQTFLVEALFDETPPVLYPGLSGEANIVIESKEKALVIPRNYLIGEDRVKTEQGYVKVSTGIKSIDSVEITSGLTPESYIYNPEK